MDQERPLWKRVLLTRPTGIDLVVLLVQFLWLLLVPRVAAMIGGVLGVTISFAVMGGIYFLGGVGVWLIHAAYMEYKPRTRTTTSSRTSTTGPGADS
jgi:hypothetical protein